MKKYSIELDDTNKNFMSSADEPATEVGIVLQIWQDLSMMEKKNGGLPHEDRVIRDVLQRILAEEFGGVEKIPMPEYYREYIKKMLQ